MSTETFFKGLQVSSRTAKNVLGVAQFVSVIMFL